MHLKCFTLKKFTKMRDDAIIIRISVITTMYAYGFDTPKDNCLNGVI